MSSVVLYIISVILIVLYGIILRATKSRDILGQRLFTHPLLQDIDGWSVTHFLFFGLLGVLYPGQHVQFFLVGYGWEVIETILGQHKFGMTGSRLQLIGEQDEDGNLTGNDDAYWYGKESDVVVDMFGYVLGSAWSEKYWPNCKKSAADRGAVAPNFETSWAFRDLQLEGLGGKGIAVRNRDELPGLADFVRITDGSPSDAEALLAALGTCDAPQVRPPQALYTNKGRVAAIKTLMRTTLATLAGAGVTVWAQGGTMLGVRRHGGMIPCDDDGDLAYLREAFPSGGAPAADASCWRDPVGALEAAFAAAGLTLQRNRTGAYWQVGTNPRGGVISPAHIDLFSYSLVRGAGAEPDRYILDDPRFAKEEPDSKQAHCNTSYLPEELFPLTVGRFYDLTINMPAQSDAVLRRALGNDYMTVMRMRSPSGEAPIEVCLRDFSPA